MRQIRIIATGAKLSKLGPGDNFGAKDLNHLLTRWRTSLTLWMAGFVCALLSACTSIGPDTLQRDRLSYADAMSDSWDQQMLKNIIKLRYGESIFFLEVDSVINQYTVEATGGVAITPGGLEDNRTGVTGRYGDRPTVTYTPLRGKEFIRQLLTPIPPTVPFILAQSGWPIDRMFEITVREVNGVANVSTAGVDQLPDPEFQELMEIFRKLQESRSLELQVLKVNQEDLRGTQVILVIHNVPQELQDDALRAAEILQVDPALRNYRVVYGSFATEPDEIAVLSRSVLEIMVELGAGIKVPTSHETGGWASGSLYQRPDAVAFQDLIDIHSGEKRPPNPYVAIRHQGAWFWIEQHDLRSKESFSFLNILTQLTSTHTGVRGPVVTIGTGQ